MTSEVSSNGWPASKYPADIGITIFPVAGANTRLRAEKTAGRILSAFAAEFHATIEPIDGGAADDWGYCYRNVRGTTDKLSNHSSGTAIDLNATRHPLGKANTFTAEQQTAIRLLCKKYGLRWGGDYKTRKDDMHFEINSDWATVEKLADKLGLPHA